MRIKSNFFHYIIASITSTLAIFYIVSTNSSQDTITLPKPPPKCREDLNFKISYQSDISAVLQKGSGFTFMGNGMITATICQPKRLEIRGYGISAAGVMPRAFVLLNGIDIAKFDFLQQQTVKLNISQPGDLSIVYMNDYYESQTRTVFLRNFKFLGDGCRSINSFQTLGDNAMYSNENEVYTISNVSKIKVYPCSSGRLFFDAAGTIGNRSYPKLSFPGTFNKDIDSLTSVFRKYSVYVSGSSMIFSISNPYASVLQDRNLYLTNIKLSDVK